jgi:RNA polymerase sigma-54 factor
MAQLNQRLSQKLQQKLSPQQIQLMKLLQIPTANLEMRIKEEMEANPALELTADMEADETETASQEEEAPEDSSESESEDTEVDDDLDLTEYLSDDDEIPDYKLSNNLNSRDEEDRSTPIRVTNTFHEHLEQQLQLTDLDDRQRTIARQLIGSIGDDGYLRRELPAVIDDLAFSANVITTEEELAELLEAVQEFDPPGVGARTLQECLMLQLERKTQTPAVKLAIRVITEQFDAFTRKHYTRLQETLKVEEEELKGAMEEILKLNPKPGGSSGDAGGNQYIVPDFIVNNVDGHLELVLNSRNAPDLRVSSGFKDMLKEYQLTKNKDKKQKEAVMFIKQKIDSAKWFIEAIRQRQQTLYNTMHAIMDHQRDFFLTGDEAQLKPMILKDIADTIGMDISTVSRVGSSKYVQTEFGTYLLKYFFSESLTNEAGEEVSTREVKKILSDMIGAEDKRDPLSDQKLMETLKEKGYNIARRTVAKYREQLNIPVARLRREL